MKAGWERTKLGNLLEIQNGYAFDSKGFSFSEGMPLIRIRDLKTGTDTESKFTGEYESKYIVRSGDLLIGMDGEFGCYEWKGDPALLNQRVCRLQNFRDGLMSRFLFYGANSHLKSIEDATAYATVKHLSSKQILDIDFPLPPVPEQQRIVRILDEAFSSIAIAKANAEKNLQNARALFESRLRKVFTKRSESWPAKKLGNVADVQSGGTPSVPRKDFWSGEIPWYSSGELNESFTTSPERYITSAGLYNSNAKVFPKGSLLIGMYDTAALKMSILDRDAAFNQAIAGVRPNNDIETEFLLHAINSMKPTLLLQRRGVRQKNLSLSKIKDIVVQMPNRSDQRKVVSSLRATAAQTQRLSSIYQQKLTALNELKKSLLHQAFSGVL